MKAEILRKSSACLLAAAVLLCIALTAEPADAATKTVKHGLEISIDLGDTIRIDKEGVSESVLEKGYTWVRFKAKKTGTLKVTAVRFADAVWLTDSKKKLLSRPDADGNLIVDEFTNVITFGVKKGKTYYLRIRSQDDLDSLNTLKTKFTALSVTGGTKKSKAKSIKKNKWQKGVIIAGTKHARWYKIKLPKSQKATIYFRFNGSQFCSFYAWSKKIGGITRKFYRENEGLDVSGKGLLDSDTKQIRTPKLPKGTVIYVKVSNLSKKDSGCYQIKWK